MAPKNGTKALMDALSEQSSAATRKAIETMEQARARAADITSRMKQKIAESTRARTKSHPELKAVRG